jgi:hypothetical protein
VAAELEADLPDDVFMGFDLHGPVAGVSMHSPGSVGVAFTTLEAAEDFYGISPTGSTNDDGVEVLWSSTYDAMQALAQYGSTSILWNDIDVHARFAIRPDEAAHTLPTFAVQTSANGRIAETPTVRCLGRVRSRMIDRGDLLWWSRFDLIDRGWSRFVDADEPLVHWPNGDPLYAFVRGESSEVWFGEEPILGPWGSADGTLAFFTGPNPAQHFYGGYNGEIRTMLSEGDDENQPIRLIQITDLKAHLANRTVPSFLATIVINPASPRGMSAIVHFNATDTVVESVAGRYALHDNNVLQHSESIDTWPGYGTMLWSGAGKYQQLDLERSFSTNAFHNLGSVDNLTSAELDDVVHDFMSHHEPVPIRPTELEQYPLADVFLISAWDTVTGLRSAECFNDVGSAIKWIADYEASVDRRLRTNGAHGSWQLGFGGSTDFNQETLLGESFQRALERQLREDVSRGHSPSQLDNVVALTNRVLRSLQIEVMGYVGDIAWRISVDDAQYENLAEPQDFPFSEGDLRLWLTTVAQEPLPEDLALVRERLGEATDLLEPNSRLFLANAIHDRKKRGGSPVMDYAPVSVGITKALEVELSAILSTFKYQHPSAHADHAIVTRNDEGIRKFFDGEYKPGLGDFVHWSKTVDNGLQRAWTDYLGQFELGRKLTNSRFRELLSKTRIRYRNGGAHDSAIPLAVCEACLSDLVGEPGKPGALDYIARVKTEARQA